MGSRNSKNVENSNKKSCEPQDDLLASGAYDAVYGKPSAELDEHEKLEDCDIKLPAVTEETNSTVSSLKNKISAKKEEMSSSIKQWANEIETSESLKREREVNQTPPDWGRVPVKPEKPEKPEIWRMGPHHLW